MKIEPQMAGAAFKPPQATFDQPTLSFEDFLAASADQGVGAEGSRNANVFGAPGYFGHSVQQAFPEIGQKPHYADPASSPQAIGEGRDVDFLPQPAKSSWPDGAAQGIRSPAVSNHKALDEAGSAAAAGPASLASVSASGGSAPGNPFAASRDAWVQAVEAEAEAEAGAGAEVRAVGMDVGGGKASPAPAVVAVATGGPTGQPKMSEPETAERTSSARNDPRLYETAEGAGDPGNVQIFDTDDGIDILVTSPALALADEAKLKARLQTLLAAGGELTRNLRLNGRAFELSLSKFGGEPDGHGPR